MKTKKVRISSLKSRHSHAHNRYETEVEQFDEALDRRVWSLSDQRRKWDLEIAKKRRITPREVEGLIHDLVTRQREYDDSAGALLEHPNMDVDDNNVDEGARTLLSTYNGAQLVL